MLSSASQITASAIRSDLTELVLEIGFGMGEATVGLAQAQPELAVLAVDLHTPGIGTLLTNLKASEISNVKVIEADALQVIRHQIADNSLLGVRVFFPDPWPKKRHHKRRLISADNLKLLASKVQLGGFLHIATDWSDYAQQVDDLLSNSANWQIVTDGHPCSNQVIRPKTKFELRGIEAGREISDLVAIRIR